MHLSKRVNRQLLAVTFLWVGVGLLPQGIAQVKEAAKIPNSIIVIFQSQTLPSHAAQHIFQAGAK